MAKSLGKKVFKRHLEGFLDPMFHSLVSRWWESDRLLLGVAVQVMLFSPSRLVTAH
jgi:hypothetical protein